MQQNVNLNREEVTVTDDEIDDAEMKHFLVRIFVGKLGTSVLNFLPPHSINVCTKLERLSVASLSWGLYYKLFTAVIFGFS